MERYILALPDTVLERWLMVAMKTRLIFLVCLLIVLILYRHCSPLLLVPVESLFLCSALGVPPLEGTKIFFYTLSSLLWPQITILQREQEKEIDFLVQKFLQRPQRLTISNSYRLYILSILLQGKSFNGSKQPHFSQDGKMKEK